MVKILPPRKQMFAEIIWDIRMSFAFLYAAHQLSKHSRGIRLYEIQYKEENYIERHKERIVNERNMLVESKRCAKWSVSFAKSARGIWSENETFLSLIIEILEAYIEYIQCQLDENFLWGLIEANNEKLLEEKHGDLLKKSGFIAEKIRLLLVSIFESMEQEDKIKVNELNDKKYGALPNLLESLDDIYDELEKTIIEKLVLE